MLLSITPTQILEKLSLNSPTEYSSTVACHTVTHEQGGSTVKYTLLILKPQGDK